MYPSFDFPDMPSDLLRPLLMGFSGKLHLSRLAESAFAQSAGPGDIFSAIGGDALLSVWAENPFDGNCVAAVAGNLGKSPQLPSPLLPVLKSVMSHWRPEITPEAEQAMAGGRETQLTFLRDRLRHAGRNLFWWHHLYEYCRMYGHWAVLPEILAGASVPWG